MRCLQRRGVPVITFAIVFGVIMFWRAEHYRRRLERYRRAVAEYMAERDREPAS
jgi:hypothetical protein